MNLAQQTETWGNEDLSWLGSQHGTEMAASVTLDRALLLAAWTDDGVVPAGVLVGRITATGLYGPYDDAAVDGRAVAAGHLIGPVGTGASGNPQGAIVTHGKVIVAKLPATSGHDAAAEADLPLIEYVA